MFSNPSSLIKICNDMTNPQQQKLLPANHRLGQRLVCPEYSKSAREIKTYPLLENERIFALCWHFNREGHLYTSICPIPEAFCYKFDINACTDQQNQLQVPTAFTGMTQLHTHDYIELAYIVSGTFHQKILGKDITFHSGEFCLIDKNCLHQDDLKNKDAVILFLGIANDMFGEIMNENVTTHKIISFLQTALMKQKDLQQYLHFKPENEAAVTDASNALSMLLSELAHHDVGSHYICKGLLLRIFRILSTQYAFSLSKEQRATMSWVIFDEVSEYMHRYYAHMSIHDLVVQFHFQEDYFNRLIKNKTGITYSGYIQSIRLEKAKQLLQTTSMTVDAVAEAVGYHNKGYFYKIFTTNTGRTPMQFRKENL
jgi:AraC-like DNA-binding protein